MKQYIDKSAVIVEIEREKAYAQTLSDNAINKSMQQFYDGMKECCNELLNSLDTLEVKEVDANDTIIERACELLARMIWEVTYEDLEGNSVQHHDKMEFIKKKKKYMKGE